MNLKKPIELNIAGRSFKVTAQNIVGGLLIVGVLGYQLSIKGGITQMGVPEAVSQKLMADNENIVAEAQQIAAEAVKTETQFAGLMPENVNLAAVHDTASEAVKVSNALHAGAQLALFALARERKDAIVKSINIERNNPSNQACFATEWNDANCLRSVIENRKKDWEAALATPDTSDDLEVLFEQMALSLAIQEIIAVPLGAEPSLLNVYEAQLKNGNLTIDSSKSFAAIFNLLNQSEKALLDVQKAQEGATVAISNRTPNQQECLSGVISAAQIKKCGGASE